jgi:hypothetical protein
MHHSRRLPLLILSQQEGPSVQIDAQQLASQHDLKEVPKAAQQPVLVGELVASPLAAPRRQSCDKSVKTSRAGQSINRIRVPHLAFKSCSSASNTSASSNRSCAIALPNSASLALIRSASSRRRGESTGTTLVSWGTAVGRSSGEDESKGRAGPGANDTGEDERAAVGANGTGNPEEEEGETATAAGGKLASSSSSSARTEMNGGLHMQALTWSSDAPWQALDGPASKDSHAAARVDCWRRAPFVLRLALLVVLLVLLLVLGALVLLLLLRLVLLLVRWRSCWRRSTRRQLELNLLQQVGALAATGVS